LFSIGFEAKLLFCAYPCFSFKKDELLFRLKNNYCQIIANISTLTRDLTIGIKISTRVKYITLRQIIRRHYTEILLMRLFEWNLSLMNKQELPVLLAQG